jgi:hypothetical protein
MQKECTHGKKASLVLPSSHDIRSRGKRRAKKGKEGQRRAKKGKEGQRRAKKGKEG